MGISCSEKKKGRPFAGNPSKNENKQIGKLGLTKCRPELAIASHHLIPPRELSPPSLTIAYSMSDFSNYTDIALNIRLFG